MNPVNQIDNIIACFGRANWLVQKARENYWVLRPRGTFGYKRFLLTYNPFTSKFQIVKPPNFAPHYNLAVKILEASDRPTCKKSDRSSKVSPDLSIIKVPSMFPVKIDNQWINLAAIMTFTILSTDSGLEVDIIWENGEETTFYGKKAAILVAEYEKAASLIRQRLETA